MLPGRKYGPQDYVVLAWRWRWLLLCPPVVGLFAALVVSAKIPNHYQSDMLIQVVPQRVPESFVRSTVTIRTDERIEALFRQLLSRTQLEAIIRELNLYPEESARLPMEDVVDLMRTNVQLQVETRRGPQGPLPADAFHIKFTYGQPAKAAQVTQRLGSLIVDQNSRDRGELADGTNEFLESQMAEARGRLEAQEQKLEQFRMRNAGRLPTQLDFNMQAFQSTQLQLQALIESLARDRDRKLILERLYNDARTVSAPVSVAIPSTQQDANAAPTTSPQRQLEIATANLGRLELRLKPGHPDIVRGRRLVADLERQVEAAALRDESSTGSVAPPTTPEEQAREARLGQMRADIESLDRQIAFKETEELRVRAIMADHQRRIEAVPSIESEWLSLTRDYDTQQTTYRELLSKSEASKVSANLERRQIGEQFRVVDPARVPIHAIWPIRLQISGIGVAVGLLFGVGLVALLVVRDSSFRTEDDIFLVLGLPVVAIVPYVESGVDRVRRRWRRVAYSGAGAAALAVGGYVFWAMELWKYVV